MKMKMKMKVKKQMKTMWDSACQRQCEVPQ